MNLQESRFVLHLGFQLEIEISIDNCEIKFGSKLNRNLVVVTVKQIIQDFQNCYIEA